MLILGHRGASADFPENTLEAFKGAAAQGADGVELDVMRCGTGELVVCHDEQLDRLARKRWVVARTPWWRLRDADVGSALGFAPAKIPLLEDVLDALPGRLMINIELKCDANDDHGLSVAVGRLLERRDEGERVLVSSFNPLCLVRLARAAPALLRGMLIDPDRRWFPQAWLWQPLVGRDAIHPHHSQCTPERVAFWHERGLKVAVWTVDDVAIAGALQEMGVDLLITNRPAVIGAFVRSRGRG
jgi:glycerophosphoryl diester phosphodiesterase